MDPVETRSPGTAAPPLYGLYVVALACCGLGNLLIRLGNEAGWLPAWGKAVLGVASALPLVFAAAYFWRLVTRGLDEMLQRVALEGLAFAFIVYVPLAALYVNLRTAGVWTPRLDPPDILMTPALLLAIGVAVAWRRFR